MAKKIKGAAKAKSTTGKRTVKTKSTTAKAGGFTLNVPAAYGKKLSLIAESDKSFKGSNPGRYAMHLIKNAVAADKT